MTRTPSLTKLYSGSSCQLGLELDLHVPGTLRRSPFLGEALKPPAPYSTQWECWLLMAQSPFCRRPIFQKATGMSPRQVANCLARSQHCGARARLPVSPISCFFLLTILLLPLPSMHFYTLPPPPPSPCSGNPNSCLRFCFKELT